jgi:hypothetical protein
VGEPVGRWANQEVGRPCGKLSELEDEGGMNDNVEVEKKKEE